MRIRLLALPLRFFGWALAGLVTFALPAVGCAGAQPMASFSETRVVLESEGWKIIGDLAVPKSAAPVPVVIQLNKAAGSRSAYRELAGQLFSCGIASMRLDLRGHGESTNLGKFVPGQNTEILKDTQLDIIAAIEFLKKDKRIDARRIGIVGSSYTGEEMMEAGRAVGYAAAYVGLSPGSLSDESIAAIDQQKLPWLLVVCRHERFLKEVAQAFRDQSRTGEFLEVPGTTHAIDLLATQRDLPARIAVWFRYRLR